MIDNYLEQTGFFRAGCSTLSMETSREMIDSCLNLERCIGF